MRSRPSPIAPLAPCPPNPPSNQCSPCPPRLLRPPGAPQWPPSIPAPLWRDSLENESRSMGRHPSPSRRSPRSSPREERPPRPHHHVGASAQTPGSDQREHNQSLRVGATTELLHSLSSSSCGATKAKTLQSPKITSFLHSITLLFK